MSNYFLIGTDIDSSCKGLDVFVRIVKKALIPIFQVIIPIALILYGTVDLGKAVIASDEKEIKEAQGRLIKRFIYAAAVFFVVTFVTVVMNIVSKGGEGDTESWANCWSAAGK
jgi:hypothetical protein